MPTLLQNRSAILRRRVAAIHSKHAHHTESEDTDSTAFIQSYHHIIRYTQAYRLSIVTYTLWQAYHAVAGTVVLSTHTEATGD